MKKLKVGIIGADQNLRAALPFLALPRDKAEIVAVADRDPAKLAETKEKYPDEPAKYYETAEELIADPAVEAVFIMVRDQYHEEMAVKCLEVGKAVFLEKPMAITIEGCDHILEAAYRTKSRLMIGHNLRYALFTRKMKELVDSGIIGEIQSVWCRHFVAYGSCYFRSWCADRRNTTGLLLQKGCHDIDIIQWIAGAAPAKVVGMGRLSVYNQITDRYERGTMPDRKYAFRQDAWPPLEQKNMNPDMDVEDHNMVMMQLENGIQATYMHCMYTPDSERNYTFIGTKGRIENVGDFGGECQIHVWTQRGSRQKPDIIYNVTPVTTEGHGGCDFNIVPDFVDAILNEKPIPVSPIDARNAVAAGCLGHESMRNGCMPQDVPPVPAEWIEYFGQGQIK